MRDVVAGLVLVMVCGCGAAAGGDGGSDGGSAGSAGSGGAIGGNGGGAGSGGAAGAGAGAGGSDGGSGGSECVPQSNVCSGKCGPQWNGCEIVECLACTTECPDPPPDNNGTPGKESFDYICQNWPPMQNICNDATPLVHSALCGEYNPDAPELPLPGCAYWSTGAVGDVWCCCGPG